MEKLEIDIVQSREYEMKTYIDSMSAMYENSVLQCGELFDIADELTKGFSEITKESIVYDSRIIKIFRYIVTPSISQMKFGQLFGLSTIETLERDKLINGKKMEVLKSIAPKLVDFITKRLDRTRFIWLDEEVGHDHKKLASEYSKKWTCSLMADQNSQTQYRTWRKTRQEAAIEHQLIELGYIRSTFSGEITRKNDIKIGEYSKEQKVHGGTSQKADFIVRKKNGGRLILVEAKAVGVQVDAYKRIKECCDKSRDWSSSKDLGDMQTVAVIAGFFNPKNIDALIRANIEIIWEHRLSDFGRIL